MATVLPVGGESEEAGEGTGSREGMLQCQYDQMVGSNLQISYYRYPSSITVLRSGPSAIWSSAFTCSHCSASGGRRDIHTRAAMRSRCVLHPHSRPSPPPSILVKAWYCGIPPRCSAAK